MIAAILSRRPIKGFLFYFFVLPGYYDYLRGLIINKVNKICFDCKLITKVEI